MNRLPCELESFKILLPLPPATSAKSWGAPPPYDLGFKVSPAYEGVRVYAIVWIAFACAGHDLAGPCEPEPYNIVLPLPTAASAKHWGKPPPHDLRFRVSPAYEGARVYATV